VFTLQVRNRGWLGVLTGISAASTGGFLEYANVCKKMAGDDDSVSWLLLLLAVSVLWKRRRT